MTHSEDSAWDYGELATLAYQLDKPVGFSLGGDVEFYVRRMSQIDGNILEPAVGTGRILIPLLREGLRVTGYDTSEHMLRACRENLAVEGLEAEVFAADMSAFRRPDYFSAALVPAGSIILLPDRETVGGVLRQLRDSLHSGGSLLIDVPVPDLDLGPGPLRRWWNGDSELVTLQTMHTDVDMLHQRVSLWQRYERWRDGVLVDTQLQIGRMLWFGLVEFTDLLWNAGFAAVTVIGDYDGEPTPQTRVWTFEAVK